MARPLRIEFAGAIYHVCSRMLGPWRQQRDGLFRDYDPFGRTTTAAIDIVLDAYLNQDCVSADCFNAQGEVISAFIIYKLKEAEVLGATLDCIEYEPGPSQDKACFEDLRTANDAFLEAEAAWNIAKEREGEECHQ